MVRCSVVIAVYNGEKYIKSTLDSIINQNYENMEVIVVDDGSNDGTAMILKDFGEQIKYFRSNRVGPGGARNIGIQNSMGEYIAFCDADDLWVSDKLRKQIQFMDNNLQVIGCYSDCEYIDQNNCHIEDVDSISKIKDKTFYEKLLLGGNYVCFSSLLIRKVFLERVGGFDESPELIGSEDYDLLIRLAKEGEIRRVYDRLIQYRKYRGSLSSSNEKSFHSTLKVICKEMNKADWKNSFKKKVLCNFYDTFAYDFIGDGNSQMAWYCIRKALMKNCFELRIQKNILRAFKLLFQQKYKKRKHCI
ncbi:MAG: glycosyltransferase [Lachnospiraceae bacterium]|nr:glycosyltransferase [Lachnospiraceae bacterium]